MDRHVGSGESHRSKKDLPDKNKQHQNDQGHAGITVKDFGTKETNVKNVKVNFAVIQPKPGDDHGSMPHQYTASPQTQGLDREKAGAQLPSSQSHGLLEFGRMRNSDASEDSVLRGHSKIHTQDPRESPRVSIMEADEYKSKKASDFMPSLPTPGVKYPVRRFSSHSRGMESHHPSKSLFISPVVPDWKQIKKHPGRFLIKSATQQGPIEREGSKGHATIYAPQNTNTPGIKIQIAVAKPKSGETSPMKSSTAEEPLHTKPAMKINMPLYKTTQPEKSPMTQESPKSTSKPPSNLPGNAQASKPLATEDTGRGRPILKQPLSTSSKARDTDKLSMVRESNHALPNTTAPSNVGRAFQPEKKLVSQTHEPASGETSVHLDFPEEAPQDWELATKEFIYSRPKLEDPADLAKAAPAMQPSPREDFLPNEELGRVPSTTNMTEQDNKSKRGPDTQSLPTTGPLPSLSRLLSRTDDMQQQPSPAQKALSQFIAPTAPRSQEIKKHPRRISIPQGPRTRPMQEVEGPHFHTTDYGPADTNKSRIKIQIVVAKPKQTPPGAPKPLPPPPPQPEKPPSLPKVEEPPPLPRKSKAYIEFLKTVSEFTEEEAAHEHIPSPEYSEETIDVIKLLKKFGIPDQTKPLESLLDKDTVHFDFGGLMRQYYSYVLRSYSLINMQDRYRGVGRFSNCFSTIDISKIGSREEELQKYTKNKLRKLDEKRERLRRVAVDDDHFNYLKNLANDQATLMPLTLVHLMNEQMVPVLEDIFRFYGKNLGTQHKCTKVAGFHYVKMRKRVAMYNHICGGSTINEDLTPYYK